MSLLSFAALRPVRAAVPSTRPRYSTAPNLTPPPPPKRPSPHSQWYSDTVPAMIPVFLLGSAIYLGLQLTQQKLSHEKYMEEAQERVRQLEAQVRALEEERSKGAQEQASPVSPAGHQPTNPRPRSRWW
ncbi:hypothetical protein AX16_000229 [Volvariella volvacea WC 439]|nr:hypothetical protein AX16_000229 [Volvariella volvacea WC 439]